jgi:hypothetical protein
VPFDYGIWIIGFWRVSGEKLKEKSAYDFAHVRLSSRKYQIKNR